MFINSVEIFQYVNIIYSHALYWVTDFYHQINGKNF